MIMVVMTMKMVMKVTAKASSPDVACETRDK